MSTPLIKREKLIKKSVSKTAKLIFGIVCMLILFGVCYVLLFPVLYMFSTAIKPDTSYMDPSIIWLPKVVTTENFVKAMEAMNFQESLKTTVSVNIVSAVFSTLSCAVVGYGFAAFKFKGKNILFAMVLFTLIIPDQTLLIPQFLNFRNLGLLDTPFSFYLPAITGVGIRSGLSILIFRQFFSGLAKELEEAAKIDGCSPFGVFLKVMAPNAKPAFFTVLIFSIVWYWNDYYMSSMFFSKNYPVSVSLSLIRSGLQIIGVASEYTDPMVVRTYLQAGSLVVILPLIIFYIFTQRFFTESLERTGIVG